MITLGVKFAHFNNLFGGDLGPSVLFANVGYAVNPAIIPIRLASIPSQVFRRVIEMITVIVTGHHSFGARANKSKQDKTVYRDLRRNAQRIFDGDVKPTAIPSGGLENSANIRRDMVPFAKSPMGTHTPLVANIVARKAGNLFPLLRHWYTSSIGYRYYMQTWRIVK